MLEFLGSVPSLTVPQYIVRTLLVGLIIFLAGKYISKRALNYVTAYDFVLVWIIGALSSAPLLDSKLSMYNTLISLATLFFWHITLSYISIKSRTAAKYIQGKPIILIQNGKMVRKNMRRTFFSTRLLLSELRRQGVANIADVEFAILETTGEISVIKKFEAYPATAKDWNIEVSSLRLPITVIHEGKVLAKNLATTNFSQDLLEKELQKNNIKRIADVFFASVDGDGNLYFSLK